MRLAGAALAIAAGLSVVLLWPARGSGNLVIYSAMGPPGTMIPAFEAQTGLHATYINMAGGPMQARIYAEGGHPNWTIAWFVGDAAMSALDAAGLLARHPGPDANWVDADWTREARATLPADGAYVPTGLTLAGVFLTRGGVAPTDWAALPAIGGRVGLVSPVASGTAYPVLSAMMQAAGGVGPGHDLLLSLRQHGLSVAPSNPLLIAQVRRGEAVLGVLPSQAAYALAQREPGFVVTLPRPAGLMPAVIAISASASPADQVNAGRFVRFLLTPEGQRLVRESTAEGYAWPPVAGVPPPDGLPPLQGLDLVHPDPVAWGARQGDEIGWFRREIAP